MRDVAVRAPTEIETILKQRSEIDPAPETGIGEDVARDTRFWWPRVELNHGHKDFQTARIEADL